MKIEVLISKIKLAVVTEANLDYHRGSITLDPILMESANMYEWQKVDINNKTNGFRGTTYIIVGKRGTNEVCANGALAHHISKGDEIHINAYGLIDEKEAQYHKPIFV